MANRKRRVTTSWQPGEFEHAVMKRLATERQLTGKGRWSTLQDIHEEAFSPAHFWPVIVEQYKEVFGITPEEDPRLPRREEN